MNDLSWLIYAADVAGTVKTIGSVVLAGSGVVAVGGVVGALAANDAHAWGIMDKDVAAKKAMSRAGAWKRVLPYAIVAAIVVTAFPSPATIYAIAASEMGESVLKSETGGKAVEALNAWLDRQIGQATEQPN